MQRDAALVATERLYSIANILGDSGNNQAGISAEFLAKLRESLLTDPDLPKADPTISLWQEPANPKVASIRSAVLPKYTDYIVIGSGITGCSITKGLLDNSPARFGNKPHVTVLEARTLVSGATGRNGGHLVSPAGHYYDSLAKRHGKEAAADICRFSILNVETVMELIGRLDPSIAQESQFRAVTRITNAIDKETLQEFDASLAAFRAAVPEYRAYHSEIQAHSMADVSKLALNFTVHTLTSQKWNLKDCSGSIEHKAAALWPYRLITGIFSDLLDRYPYNLAIETNTPAVSVETVNPELSAIPGSDYKYCVTTPRGIIYAKQVIHCTNGHAAHLLRPLLGKLHPFRGTMSVQKPPASVANLGAERSWSAVFPTTLDANTGLYTEGLYYMQQNARDGNIWVGHERSSIFETMQGDDTYVSQEAYEALLKFLPAYMRDWPEGVEPDLKGIWTGIQGHTTDGLPIIGKLTESLNGRPGSDGEWFCGGYSGYGMDKAWLSGQALVKMIHGEGAPDWLPKCFLIDNQRMEKLTLENSIAKWVSLARTGHW
ncbi:hypothetical protein NQ176_g4545 [Zarea fungicola]|uniref:Uncharacterized protein n=1 Tax=Zarea fungicola TaxID=93591 RepID=A0ACC1NDU5_9HYPO|nr:hypothetical protein NQ176_g4545 [Lecanicillium fungicola]